MLKYLIIIFILIFSSCNRSDLQDSIDKELIKSDKYYPNNIQLYSGYDSNIPIRAWAVVILKNDKGFKVLISDDDDGVETPQDFSNENEAFNCNQWRLFFKRYQSYATCWIIKIRR